MTASLNYITCFCFHWIKVAVAFPAIRVKHNCNRLKEELSFRQTSWNSVQKRNSSFLTVVLLVSWSCHLSTFRCSYISVSDSLIRASHRHDALNSISCRKTTNSEAVWKQRALFQMAAPCSSALCACYLVMNLFFQVSASGEIELVHSTPGTWGQEKVKLLLYVFLKSCTDFTNIHIIIWALWIHDLFSSRDVSARRLENDCRCRSV